MNDFNLIIGIHSIVCALKNKKRKCYHLVGTEESLEEIKKLTSIDHVETQMYSTHKVQEEAKRYFRDLDLDYHRVPSSVFLVCSELEILDVSSLYRAAEEKENLKIICLDQITDVHNAAAILRTASFYGIDYVVVPDKKSFGLTPSFFRISSGAAEYVPLVGVSKLTKTLTKLKSLGVVVLALSEHAKGDLTEETIRDAKQGLCLVLGREDVGISNAVLRIIDNHISLDSYGDIKSLNVSIAAAITMEKCFNKK